MPSESPAVRTASRRLGWITAYLFSTAVIIVVVGFASVLLFLWLISHLFHGAPTD